MLMGLILLGLVLTGTPVWAAPVPGIAITFNDLTETLSVTFSPSDQTRASGGCSQETCTVVVNPPVGATDFFIPSAISIGDPITRGLSDFIFFSGFTLDQTEISSITVHFISDGDPEPCNNGCGQLCGNGCDVLENGGIQQLPSFSSLIWFTGSPSNPNIVAIDTIFFASDASDIDFVAPEPPSLLLFLLGLPVMAALALRRGWASR